MCGKPQLDLVLKVFPLAPMSLAVPEESDKHKLLKAWSQPLEHT